jgi:hypothetical protein
MWQPRRKFIGAETAFTRVKIPERGSGCIPPPYRMPDPAVVYVVGSGAEIVKADTGPEVPEIWGRNMYPPYIVYAGLWITG